MTFSEAEDWMTKRSTNVLQLIGSHFLLWLAGLSHLVLLCWQVYLRALESFDSEGLNKQYFLSNMVI